LSFPNGVKHHLAGFVMDTFATVLEVKIRQRSVRMQIGFRAKTYDTCMGIGHQTNQVRADATPEKVLSLSAKIAKRSIIESH
jgi:hypothetical protein